MKKTISYRITTSVFIGLLLSSSVAMADKTVYVAVNAFEAEYEDVLDETGFSLAVGKYLGANERVSVELGYANFGEISNGVKKIEFSAVQLSALGYLPLGNGGLFGRVGAEQVTAEGDVFFNGNLISGSDDETGAFFGVGAYYNIGENVDLRVEYQKHDVSDLDIDTISTGVTFETF